MNKLTRILSISLAVVCLSLIGPATMRADSTTGTLNFDGNPLNYFDPTNGFVPAGYSNSSPGTNTITIPGTFGYMDAANIDTAQFTGSELIVTDTCELAEGCGDDSWVMTFTNPGYGSLALISDNFPNGATTGALTSSLITISWGGGEVAEGTYTATYSFAAPEPGSFMLLGTGLISFAGLRRRKIQA